MYVKNISAKVRAAELDTTPNGTLDGIILGADQTIGDLNFGFLAGG